MGEHPSFHDPDIADDLLDLISLLLQKIRDDLPRDAGSEQATQEWRDISELRATTGQVRLLRILTTHQRCTMQELADYLGVALPSVTAMVKRLLSQGFVERIRDEQDWRFVWVLPTERGRHAVALFGKLRRASLQRRLAHLSPEELAQLHATLPILRHLIEVEP
ncbi:MAG: MarR family transcriptional regulator [Ktedonobacteraceae bacterium]|nr:MarR family transcriptional regulator [Ktedonobacteraceae bacterium]MBO0791403.1 MarR family transcriptional regulator [Ktedonobacteraceae bacterium]